MPLDFSNAQNVMYWGAAVDDSTTTSTEQPALTPEQIAEKQHQDLMGIGLFFLVLVWLIFLVKLGDRNTK